MSLRLALINVLNVTSSLKAFDETKKGTYSKKERRKEEAMLDFFVCAV